MGKVLFTKKNENGDINYVAGRVSFIQEGTGSMEGQVVNVGMTLTVYNRETKTSEKKYLSVGFFNNDRAKMADRVRNAKVHAGSFVLVTCGTFRDTEPAKDGTPRMTAIGMGFDYSTQRTISNAEGQEYNLIVGTARRIIDDPDNKRVNITVPTTVFNRDTRENETKWFGVTCANTEKSNIYDRAKAAIVDGSAVAFLTSRVRVTEKDGKVYNDVLAFDLVAVPPQNTGDAA